MVDGYLTTVVWSILKCGFLQQEALLPLHSLMCHSKSCQQCRNKLYNNTHRHTHTPFNSPWSTTTRVDWYQKKHSPTHTHPDRWTSFINLLHLLWSIASSLFNLHAWPSFFYNLCPGPLWSSSILGPSTSYSIHFFTQSSSSFHSTCPYHRSLFCCSTNVISSVPNLSHLLTWKSVFYLNATHPSDHSHLCSLKCQVSLPCNLLFCTQLLYNLPFIINDTFLCSGTNYLNLFQPVRILASTAVSASPSTLNMSPSTYPLSPALH